MVYNWSNWLRKRLFPPRCRLCLAAGHNDLDLCKECHEELPWLGITCRTCAMPLTSSQSGLCARCLQTSGSLDACHALFAYQPPVDTWIQALKFKQDLALAGLLGRLLAQHPAIIGRSAQIEILAVPLHPQRLKQRGYNQARELARPLLGSGFRSANFSCRRERYTTAQSTLDRDERRRNLRGAFSVAAPLGGQQVLLVDDVITTGATLNELATALKRAGAVRVEAIAVARTLVH